MRDIGVVYCELGRYNEAWDCFRKSLDIAKSLSQNMEHPLIAQISACIGATFSGLGELSSALEYFILSLEMLKGMFGTEAVYPNISALHGSIGLLYLKMGKYELAVEHMKSGIDMAEKLYGKNNFIQADCYLNISLVYCMQYNLVMANKYFTKSIEALEASKCDIGENLIAAQFLNKIGIVHSTLGNNVDALQHFLKSLYILKKYFGEDAQHPQVDVVYINIARVYWRIIKQCF